MSMLPEQPDLLPLSYQMYEPQLSSLISFLKTDSEKAHTIQQRLFEGDEGIIRNMLINFGNPDNEEWKDFLEVLPWANWQIDAAVQDIKAIKHPDAYPPAGYSSKEVLLHRTEAAQTDVVKFWAW